MKVLQLGKFYPIKGGVEKVMWDLARGVDAHAPETGIQCDMLCAMLPKDNPAKGQWPFIVNFENGGRCICAKSTIKAASTMLSWPMIKWLKEHCNEYDLIHVHHPDPMACLALRMSDYKGKVFLHWHSDILKQKIILQFYKPLQNWLIKRADKIIGTTPVYVQQSQFLQSVQDKLVCLPIGVEDSMRWPDDHVDEVKPSGKKIIFSLGRLVEYKGFEYLIEAARMLPPEYEIQIGGTGPLWVKLQTQIFEQFNDSKPHASVRLMGYLSNEQCREMFNRCSVFVLSSSMKTEAFGIVQIEAMSCGKPVVTTHIPGSGVDWVNLNGVSGLNVDITDSKALADAIYLVSGSERRYKQFCKDARQRYIDVFSFKAMIDRYLEILQS